MASLESPVALSRFALGRINKTRKRRLSPKSSKDAVAKRNREKGHPYKSRNGDFHPGLLPPQQPKVCGACSKYGCNLPLTTKQELFQNFRKLDHTKQNGVLAGCVKVETPKVRTVQGQSRKEFTYEYTITHLGTTLQTCKSGFMDIFKVTSKRLRTIISKIRLGEMIPESQTGRHNHRPTRITDEVKDRIRDHIKSFPTVESHYARKDGEPQRQYLEADLTLGTMYNLFIERCRVNDEEECSETMYRSIFNTEFDLRIGRPKQDLCDRCELYRSEINQATTQIEKNNISNQRDLHHLECEESYKRYKEDCSSSSDSKIVLTGDLQQVLFTPGLKNSSSFYLRKLSTYNYCIHDSRDHSGTMYLWTETDGGRGSNEIASCIWKHCHSKFGVLPVGQERELIFWSDRCVGQNNNYIVLTTFMKLVQIGLFTSFHQKFFMTGHSYNTCDRDFGHIEKQLRVTSIVVPQDIEKIIYNARVENPFDYVWMRLGDFLNFKALSISQGRPSTLKVSQNLWFHAGSSDPNHLFTRETHFVGIWTKAHILPPRANLAQPFTSTVLQRAYPSSLRIDEAKIDHLKKLMKFLDGENLLFYEYLIFEQEGLF